MRGSHEFKLIEQKKTLLSHISFILLKEIEVSTRKMYVEIFFAIVAEQFTISNIFSDLGETSFKNEDFFGSFNCFPAYFCFVSRARVW